jgi:hypothetical protein
MSEKPLVNAPNDPPPAPMKNDDPVIDQGGKTNYPVAAKDVVLDKGKPNYPVAAKDVVPDKGKTNYPVAGGE